MVIETTGGTDPERMYKEQYRGTDRNWKWFKREVQKIGPAELRRRVESMPIDPPNDRLKVGPCIAYGVLEMPAEQVWLKGLEDGRYAIQEVVPAEAESRYWADRKGRVPRRLQDV